LGTQVASPVGKTLGYLLHVFFGDKFYYKGFTVAGIYFFLIFVFILFAPNYYFSNSISRSKKVEEKKKLAEDERQSITSIFSLKKEKTDKKDSFFNKLLIIVTNSKWLLANIASCVINGVLSTTHYWCSDYMRNALNVNDSKTIILSYSTVCLLSPLISMVFTSIFNQLFGGYESKNATIITIFISIFTVIFGVGSTYMNELLSFLITLIMFFAFGTSLLSMSIGLILVCIDEKLKEHALSFTTIINMFITGNLFPLLYGIINDYFKVNDNKRMGMRFTLSLPIISIISLIFLHITLKKEEENKEEPLIEKENNEK
jgi:MFS family permease